MKKKKQLAEIANEAIEAYMTLIAQVDAMANPMIQLMIEPKRLLKEAMDMSDRVEAIMGGDEWAS